METHLDDLNHSNRSTGKGRSSSKTHRNKDDLSETTKNRKKESSSKSTSRQKQSSHASSSSHQGGGRVSSPNESTNFSSSRYYYREVPPRFQTHKYTGGNKSANSKSSQSSKTQSSKKSSKDTSNSRWPSHSSTSTDSNKWPTSPDTTETKSNKGNNSGGGGGGGANPSNDTWSNQWMSDEDSFSNSDPIAENDLDDFSSGGSARASNDKKGPSQDLASDWEEAYDPALGLPERPSKKDDASVGGDVGSPSGNDSPDGGPPIDDVWRSRNSVGSTSSVNSVGSNSSWKGNNGGGGARLGNAYQRSSSPRKQGRYDSHRSVSMSSSGGSGRVPGGRYSCKKKPVMDLGDAIENLQSEPSGWGDLPSPKQTTIDTGTEVWGIPDDVKQKMKKEHKSVAVSNWSDVKTVDHWGDDGTLVAGWNHNGGGSEDKMSEGWDGSNEPGWNTVVNKGKNRASLSENVKVLVDMGFSPSSSEKALKMNNDNLEATIGDLLALSAIKDEDHHDASSSHNYLPSTTSSSSTTRLQKQTSLPGSSSNHMIPPVSLPITSSVPKDTMYLTTPNSSSGSGTPNGSSPQKYFPSQVQQQKVSPNSPAASLDLPNLQQVLGQQLSQYQLMKQRLTIQLNQVKTTSALPSPQLQKQHQLLSANLNHVNNNIYTISKQLVTINHLVQQQSLDEKDGKEASRLASGGNELTNGISDVNYSLQSMSLCPPVSSISQSSARTLSRLQQIINNQQQADVVQSPTVELSPEKQLGEGEVAQTQSVSDELFAMPSSTQQEQPLVSSSVSTSSSSTTSRFSSSRSVDDIPEFKPGVPWNPHAHSSNQAQAHTKSSSVTTPTTPNDFGSLYPDGTGGAAELYSPQGSGYGGRSPRINPQYGSGPMHYEQFGGSSQNRYGNMGGGAAHPFQPYSTNRSNSYNGPFNSGFGGGYNEAGGAMNAYKNYGMGSQQKQMGGGGFPPGARPHRPRLQQQHSYGGFPNNSGVGGGPNGMTYGPIGGRSSNSYRGGQSNGQGSSNKWNFDGSNPWGMPATSGSIWSMESDTLLNSTASSNFSEWKGTGSARKPSLPLQLSAPTNYIILKNVSPQIDETSLREVCYEYGKVVSCSINPFNETVLIQYSSKDEAASAKAGLEKNPSICGVYVIPSYASENDIVSFTEQRTPSNPSMSFSSALNITATSWLNDRPKLVQKKPSGSLWGSGGGGGDAGAPQGNSGSSSVWSNGSALPGISTPWNVPSSQQLQEKDEAISSTPPLSTFLPNGLF